VARTAESCERMLGRRSNEEQVKQATCSMRGKPRPLRVGRMEARVVTPIEDGSVAQWHSTDHAARPRRHALRRASAIQAHARCWQELLWSEYQEGVAARGDGPKRYQYSQFCELYGAWRVRLKPSMRRVHLAGEKSISRLCRQEAEDLRPETGEAREVEVFVMCWAPATTRTRRQH
jgi:hypothetical protein